MVDVIALRDGGTDAALAAMPAKPGREWPPNEHRGRMSGYTRYRQLFDGDHGTALQSFEAEKFDLPVIANLAKNIVTITADMLFGEPLELDFPDDATDEQKERIQAIWERSEADELFYENAIDGDMLGDALFSLERDDAEEVRFRSRPAETWYPTANPDDCRDIFSHTMAWERSYRRADGKERMLLRVQIYERGAVRNELWVLERGKIDGNANDMDWAALYPSKRPEPVVETGIDDDFLLFHVPAFRSARAYFGQSAYVGLESLFAAIDTTLSDTHKILIKHSDPAIALPWALYQQLRAKHGDRIPTWAFRVLAKGADAGDSPEYITWDGRLDQNMAFADKLVALVAVISETAPQLLSAGEWGADLSGRALRILLLRTLAKVARRRRYYDRVVPHMLEVAQELEGESEPITVKLKWPDGLPLDMLEQIEAAERRISAGLSTRKRELVRMEGMSEEDAEAIVAEVEQEGDVVRNNAGVIGANQRRMPMALDMEGLQ